MRPPRILPLEACLDPSVVGGKAAGLARLLRTEFLVPPGFCLTTAAYHEFLHHTGIESEHWRRVSALLTNERLMALVSVKTRVLATSWPSELLTDLQSELRRAPIAPGLRWAVRSSETHEDMKQASFAGLCRTELGVAREEVPQAILRCWASLWEPRVVNYLREKAHGPEFPAMAIVVQAMVKARAAGVAFSRHPVTGHPNHVVINAVPGLAEPLVAGRVWPDEYVVALQETPEVTRRHIAYKREALHVADQGLVTEILDDATADKPSITDEEARNLTTVVKRVELEYRQPIDVEWAIDERGLWLLQARPMTASDRHEVLTNDRCDWSRANFKETLPEVPSPLGLSFLQQFMEDFIIRHYRELGCVIPAGVSSVRIMDGRPYINVTLLQACLSQLGGQPELVTEQMGGDGHVPPWLPSPLPIWKRLKAALAMHRTIQRAAKRAPSWFAELRQNAHIELGEITSDLTAQELFDRIDRLSRYLRAGESTFAIVAGVGQALQVFGALLPPWLGKDWRSLLNAALQGQTTIISAGQIRGLSEIADRARQEAKATQFFLATSWNPSSYREQLSGTVCLEAFDAFLGEYGHRAIGESDMMTPRFSEDPTYLLQIIRAHVQQPPSQTAQHMAQKQEDNRMSAVAEIKQRCGWKYHRWVIFRWWYGRLCRALALRESNRHALMYYAAVTRCLALALGRRLRSAGRLSSADDVFFLTTDEFRLLSEESARNWKALVGERRSEHTAFAAVTVPDFIPSRGRVPRCDAAGVDEDGLFRGISISAGFAEGTVRLIQGPEDIGKVQRGDIVVTSILDPGMVTFLGLAGGVITEMGGTLSHGAIIAREYGIPAVVNVSQATRLLKDGDRVSINCIEGTVRKARA
ncbi:MAG: PEP/pyruvate-binding domain-containing protein [Nitrospiraceae bacterium]